MDELLEGLSRLSLSPNTSGDAKTVVRELLSRAFSHDFRYLGAYRAWREAVLSDSELARKQREIQRWTTQRVATLFRHLQQMPKARPGIDVQGLALVMDSLFWSLLSEAATLSKAQLRQRLDSSTHLTPSRSVH